MNAHKKMEREIERFIGQMAKLNLLDEVSVARASALKKNLKHMDLVALANVHERLQEALNKGEKVMLTQR